MAQWAQVFFSDERIKRQKLQDELCKMQKAWKLQLQLCKTAEYYRESTENGTPGFASYLFSLEV